MPAADKSNATLMSIVRSPSHVSNNSNGKSIPTKELLKNMQ